MIMYIEALLVYSSKYIYTVFYCNDSRTRVFNRSMNRLMHMKLQIVNQTGHARS